MWNGIKIPTKSDGTALFWSILTKSEGYRTPSGEWHHGNRRHWVQATPEGMSEVMEMARDPAFQAVYFSQGVYFRPGKVAGKAGIACLPWLWVDLDCHNHIDGWLNMSLDEQASFVAGEMIASGVPLPSQIISSGRGAYAIWKLDKPLWNVSKRSSARKPASVAEAIHSAIIKRLKHIGADERCAEYGRVLRVPGSRNLGAYGAIVQTIHDSGLTYEMADLKAALLTWSSDEVRAYKKAKKASSLARKRSGATVVDLAAEREKRVAGFTQRKHAHRIIEDLRKLSEIRWDGDVPEGWRDVIGHLATSAIARYHRNPATLLDEVRRFTSDFLDDPDLEEHNSTSMKLLEQGRGYAYSIASMRRLLKVTPYESPHLFALSTEEEKEARRARAERARRAQAGAKDRATYDKQRAESGAKATRPWEALGVSRATYYRQVKAYKSEPKARQRA